MPDRRPTMPRGALCALALTLAAAATLAPASSALGEQRFGDSTWVAPVPEESGDPAAPGPRVAEPDHERTWETVLRTPFRVAFFPFRLLGRGLEGAADLAEKHLPLDEMANPSAGPPRGIRVSPQATFSSTEGVGLGATLKAPLAGPGNTLRADAIWTTKDRRRARATALFGAGRRVSYSLFGMYDHRPNRRFYGIGNDAGTTRTIYLHREDRAEGALLYTRPSGVSARAFAGLSDIDVGPGYNDSPRAIKFFSASDVPFLTRGSRVWYLGLGARLASLNSSQDPASGAEIFGEARHVMDADANDFAYGFYRAEARGYAPVFSLRRVLAGRAIFEGVNPDGGADPIPFYRLPSSTREDRFAGYSSERFRDRRLALLQGEYRWLIWSKLWAFALAERAAVAPSTGAFRWSAMHEAYGGGLRYRITDKQTARLEVAKGNQGLNIDLDFEAAF